LCIKFYAISKHRNRDVLITNIKKIHKIYEQNEIAVPPVELFKPNSNHRQYMLG